MVEPVIPLLRTAQGVGMSWRTRRANIASSTLFLPDSPWYYLWWSSRCLFLKDSVSIVYSHYDAPHYVTLCDPASWCERRACCLVLCWSRSTSIGNLSYRVWHQPDSSCAHDP